MTEYKYSIFWLHVTHVEGVWGYNYKSLSQADKAQLEGDKDMTDKGVW